MKLSKPIEDLVKYLSAPAEKANEDQAIGFFRDIFGAKFTRQKEAERSDGYVAGNFVLELKGSTCDWFAGLLQGLAYGKELDFIKVVVAANDFLAVWYINDIPADINDAVAKSSGAPNAVGKTLAKKFKNRQKEILNTASYQLDSAFLPSKNTLFSRDLSNLKHSIDKLKDTLQAGTRKRQRISLKNFTSILKSMRPFFDDAQPLLAVRAFYSIIFGWDEGSKVQISQKKTDSVSVNGESVSGLKPDRREEFKLFVENHYVSDDKVPSKDVFFAHFDQALDAIDPEFRIKHGIFFTDLDLSRFAMWFVKRELGDIGKNYMVIDPACGSGNLVTNWRSPLELRHKVVSEIEPELLFAVERRMLGDEWHNGKFTVVPKVSEAKGLNFLDKSAEEYVDILKGYLKEKGLKPDKPIAFLCNPPYRSDDDQAASSISYGVHPSIVDLTGNDGASERYCCFLAQMKLICEQAESSGLPGNSLLLLFTKAAWLTDRPVFQKIRSEILGAFEDVGGIIVNGKEFFDVKGAFPVAFTIWKHNSSRKQLDNSRPIDLVDLTWVKRGHLSSIDWVDASKYPDECEKILADKLSPKVSFGVPRDNIKVWSGLSTKDFKRDRRKNETDRTTIGGLPAGDRRRENKKTYGESVGLGVGFMDELGPCRVRDDSKGRPWFHLDNRFMRSRGLRCFSGPPDNRGFSAHDFEQASRLFIWFALGRTFASEGYPMWVDALEMWGLNPTSEVVRMAFAIGFAENECVETTFPANNPIKGAPELFVPNPMSPNSNQSFWSTTMKAAFEKGDSPAHNLVKAVNTVYSKWKKHLGDKHQITVSYERPYFIGKGKLSANSGIVQIRDYAKHFNSAELLSLLDDCQAKLTQLKKQFHEMLLDKTRVNYFGQSKPAISSLKVQASEPASSKSKFQKVLDLRIAISAHIVDQLQDDPHFGRTKFAKVLYLAEQVSNVDLQTNYFREAAGPFDQRALFNEKIGIEPEAERRGVFVTKKKSIKTKNSEGEMVNYIPSKNLEKSAAELKKLIKSKASLDEIDNVIKLLEPMTTDQVEIVSTLYAAWNDLLLKSKGKSIKDEVIVMEFRDHWHERKKRFSEDKLTKALAWMRQKNLVPKGSGKLTQVKIDF